MIARIRRHASLLGGLALLACLMLVGSAAAATKPKQQLPKTLQPQPLSPPEPAPPLPWEPIAVPMAPLSPQMEAVKPKDPIPGTPPRKAGQRQVKIKVLNYNINSITGPLGVPLVEYPPPWLIFNGKRDERTAEIIEKLDADIVVLEEAFDRGAEKMLQRLKKAGYREQTAVVGERCTGEQANPDKEEWNGTYGNCSNALTVKNGGTVIISKLHMREKWQYVYKEGLWPDGQANKGVALVAFDAPGGGVFWVAGTHLQAGDSEPFDPNGKKERLRRQQLIELSDFIRFRANVAKETVLIAGDLNVPIYYDQLAGAGGRLPMDWGNHGELALFTPLKTSPGGVSVNCNKNREACRAQIFSPYAEGYEDSLDYLGYYAGTKENPGVRPLDQSPLEITRTTRKEKSGAFMSPSDHWPTESIFTLGLPEADENGTGAKDGGGQQGSGSGGNR